MEKVEQNNNNLVSIITPSYNSKNFISRTIESVQAQTYIDWEMIIVDDASLDNSSEIIESYCKKDRRVKFIRLHVNSGTAVARNRAIKEAQGRYIAFLDADDIWLPTKLEKQLNYLISNNYKFTFSKYSLIDNKGQKISKELFFPKKVSYKKLLKSCFIGCLTVIIDKTVFNDISMPNIRRGQDYALWLKLLKQIDYAYCYPDILANYRILSNSLSRNKFVKARSQWYIYRKIEKLNVFNSFYNMIFYTYYGFKKNKF